MIQRVVTGLFLSLFVILSIFYLNSVLLYFLMFLLFVYSNLEWLNIFSNKISLSYFLHFFISLLLLILGYKFVTIFFIFSVFFWFFVCTFIIYSSFFCDFKQYNSIYLYYLGFIIINPFWIALKILYSNPILLFSIILIISCIDMGAYFIGSKYGKFYASVSHISPKKTFEGFIGGIACGVISSIFVFYFLDISKSTYLLLIIFSIPFTIIAILGDLIESLIKRHCDIKDSGIILPGHGGILDLLDSFFAGLPCFALFSILYHLINL